MNKKEVTGTTREIKGKAEHTAGKAIGNERLQDHGTAEEMKGKATKVTGQIEDKVKAVKHDMKEKAHSSTK